MSGPRIIASREGRIGQLVISNPASRNGLTVEMVRSLAEHLNHFDEEPEVRAIVLRGEGEHFCSGADLKAATQTNQLPTLELARSRVREDFQRVAEALHRASKPTLAVIRGACVGIGFDFALHCHLRLASSGARFGQVFTRIGLVPDGGSSYLLPRLVGLGRAMELMLLAETLDAAEAHRLGIVNRVVAEPELDAVAGEWATHLESGPPLAYALGIANLQAGAMGGTLREALDREADAQAACLTSADFLRGVQAFFTKQPPAFKGD
jgi:enoyl-CoA hydratase/carnithine racemase